MATTKRRGTPGVVFLAVVGVAAIGLTGGLAVAMEPKPGTPPPSPARGSEEGERALRRVTAAVERAETAEFEGRITTEVGGQEILGLLFGSGEELLDGSGGDVERSDSEGRMWVGFEMPVEAVNAWPDRSRTVLDVGGGFTETLVVGDEVFMREAPSRDELEDERWTSLSTLEEDLGGMDEGFVTPLGESTSAEGMHLNLLLDAVRSPVVASSNERGETIEGALRLGRFGLADPYERGTVRIETDARHRPRSLEIRADGKDEETGGEGTFTLELGRFRWGGDVEIEEPDDDELDADPFSDEELLDNFDEAPLLQPGAIPQGWTYDYATVLEAGETSSGCAEAELDYIEGDGGLGEFDEFSFGGLYLYEKDPGCASDRPAEAVAFATPAGIGWIVASLSPDDLFGPGAFGELLVGETLIEFDASLDVPTLVRVFESFVPYDPQNPPAATIPVEKQSA